MIYQHSFRARIKLLFIFFSYYYNFIFYKIKNLIHFFRNIIISYYILIFRPYGNRTRISTVKMWYSTIKLRVFYFNLILSGVYFLTLFSYFFYFFLITLNNFYKFSKKKIILSQQYLHPMGIEPMSTHWQCVILPFN